MEETTNEATGPTTFQEGPTGPTQEEATGPTTVQEEATGPISVEDINVFPTPVAPPSILTIDDILNSVELIIKKEQDDKAILESIGTMSLDELKYKLLHWAKIGFPNVYEIHRIVVTPPSKCSDGVTRSLAEYIEFCSGKPIQDHVAVLQAKVSGMNLSFANMYGCICIFVSKV